MTSRDTFEKIRRICRKAQNIPATGVFGMRPEWREWDELEIKEWIRERMNKHKTETGTVFVHVYSRDCDHTTSYSMSEIPASVAYYKRMRDNLYDDAEGPVSMHIMTLKDAAEFEAATYYAS